MMVTPLHDLRSIHSSKALIELFELDATSAGGTVMRFHNGKNELGGEVIWQGNPYFAYPIEATGFEVTGKGQLPRPVLRVANVTGLLGALARTHEDLIGSKLTRKRTLSKYLDAANFIGGNPSADPTVSLPDDVYFIDRKASENKILLEFELSASFDVSGVTLPRRHIIQNLCPSKYRGGECGYVGTDYFNTLDVRVGPAEDVCGKRLSSCKARFGQHNELPFGGFPAAGLTR